MAFGEQAISELIKAIQDNTKINNKSFNRIKNAGIKDVVRGGVGLGKRAATLPFRAAGAALKGTANFAANEAKAAGRLIGKGAQAGVGFAAAASDPRDVTGVGSSQALNNTLDSIVGQAGGNLIRNATGLTGIQNIQNTAEGGIQGLIRSNAQAGLRTPAAQIKQANSQLRRVAQIENEELKKAKAVLGRDNADFSLGNQVEVVMNKFLSNVRLLNKELGSRRKS